MPIPNYGVLVGRVTDYVPETEEGSPHFQLEVSTQPGTFFRVAVNVRSTDGSYLRFLKVDSFQHPITDRLGDLPPGFHLASESRLALDYVRGGLFDPREMTVLPDREEEPGSGSDLDDQIGDLAERAKGADDVMVYAFGSRWGPEHKPDQVFHFRPGDGVHDIHMNQGNPPGNHDDENGTSQDGALFVHFQDEDRWVAVFLAFRTQSFGSKEDEDRMPDDAADSVEPETAGDRR